MTDTEQRFGLTMRGVDRDEPGLVRERDGTVWLVNPDGTRTQLPGGGSSTTHGLMGNALNALTPGVPIDYIAGNGVPEWAVVYDTDAYVSLGDETDFFEWTIPAGLGGLYLLETIIYINDTTDFTGAAFIFDEPSNSCDFQIMASTGAFDWHGGDAFVRPLQDGDLVRMVLAEIDGDPNVHIAGGTKGVSYDFTASNFTMTRLGPLPAGWTGYPSSP